MTAKTETKKQATHITETELWKLRALDAQQGRLQAEMQLAQKQTTEVQEQMQKLLDSLREKYGDAQVSPDGRLVYASPRPIPGIPGKPDIPNDPSSEPEEEESDDEED